MEILEPFAAATELDVMLRVGVSQSTRSKLKSAPEENPSVKFAMEPGLVEGVKYVRRKEAEKTMVLPEVV
jgi:hypothetical protein